MATPLCKFSQCVSVGIYVFSYLLRIVADFQFPRSDSRGIDQGGWGSPDPPENM